MKVSNKIENYGNDEIINKLNLSSYIEEVEEVGYTVIPPNLVASEKKPKVNS